MSFSIYKFNLVLGLIWVSLMGKAPVSLAHAPLAHEGETLFIDQVKVNGRAFTHSCQYYSNSEVELEMEFRPLPLETGSRVFLDLGWVGIDQMNGDTFSRYEPRSLELQKFAFNRWRVSLSKTIAERSSSVFLTGLHFVFRVESPGNPSQIFGGVEKGDVYFVRFPEASSFPCVSSETRLPAYQEWLVQIDRNFNN
jgi:hypothetical protein